MSVCLSVHLCVSLSIDLLVCHFTACNVVSRLRSAEANSSLAGVPHVELTSDKLEGAAFLTLTVSQGLLSL